MDTEKKLDETPKQDIGEIVSDLVVSGATVLAHSAAEAIVKRVRKAAAKTSPVKAVAKELGNAKKLAVASKPAKAKRRTSKKSVAKKSSGKKVAKNAAKKATRKNSKQKSKKSKR